MTYLARASLLLYTAMIFSVMGCKSTAPQGDTELKARSPEGRGQATETASAPVEDGSECVTEGTICTEEFNPSVCTAYVYDGKRQPIEVAPKGWGANPCVARTRLIDAVCAKGMKPTRMAEIECVPDATEGRCPVEETLCTMEFSPARCHVEIYDGQELPVQSQPTASGSNACAATKELRRLACHLNLDPSKLGEVVCVADTQRATCPPGPPDCAAEGGAQTACSLDFEGKDMEVTGESVCEAKWRLARLACAKGLDPAKVKMACGPLD